MIIEQVLDQHAESAILWWSRYRRCTQAPDVSLAHLARFSEQLAAHLDGLRVAGEPALRALSAYRDPAQPGASFCLAVLGMERQDLRLIGQLVALAEGQPRQLSALEGSWDWIVPARPVAIRDYYVCRVAHLLAMLSGGSKSAVALEAAQLIERYGERLVDAGGARRIVSFAAETASPDVLNWCAQREWSGEGASSVAVASAAVLMGARAAAIERLQRSIESAGALPRQVMLTLLAAVPLDRARDIVKTLGGSGTAPHLVIQAVGAVGDPAVIPWLIQQMSDPGHARCAAEAFELITGVDLSETGLERSPQGAGGGPTDDPDDALVAIDDDDGIAWPDPEKLTVWWGSNRHRYPTGQRLFMGAPPSMPHCVHVLKSGFQRQREAAAIWRCILQPGTPLFPVRAPAWRQHQWLTQIH